MNLNQFKYLISEKALPNLEEIAQKAHKLTQQRFGNTLQIFVPLYLANVCYSNCVYCGYSVDRKFNRVVLNEERVLKEGLILKEKGFKHILLLTGEAPKETSVAYIKRCIKILKPHFASIGLEIYPLKTDEYKILIEAGADSLAVYQETYHKPTYKQMHLSGKKSNYDYRLDTPDRAGAAGFYRIHLGALLGLYEWKYEAVKLAKHIIYLQKKHWKTKFSVSMPRIQEMGHEFLQPYPVTDTDLVQFICAFRLTFPDLGITLSTREPASLRDRLLKLGITQISAESSTSPGGYSSDDGTNQFEVSDTRTLKDIKKLLVNAELEPVMKDWQ